MRAAERLIADKGIENVTVRAIVEASGQKNESALQYHFGSRDGLIREIHKHRRSQIGAKRNELLANLQSQKTMLLRDIVNLMVAPAFLLAREQADFRRYIKAFGHEIYLSEKPVANKVREAKSSQIGSLLRKYLSKLSDETIESRIDGAIRFASLSMSQQAKKPKGFRGNDAELFYSQLVDAIVGLLDAEESEETRNLIKA